MFPRNPPVPRPLTHAHKKRKWVEEGKGEKTSVLECLNNSRSREEEEEDGVKSRNPKICVFLRKKEIVENNVHNGNGGSRYLRKKITDLLSGFYVHFELGRKEEGGGILFNGIAAKTGPSPLSPIPLLFSNSDPHFLDAFWSWAKRKGCRLEIQRMGRRTEWIEATKPAFGTKAELCYSSSKPTLLSTRKRIRHPNDRGIYFRKNVVALITAQKICT